MSRESHSTATGQGIWCCKHLRLSGACVALVRCGPQDALLAMDASALSVEQLDALSRAVPDDSERRDIRQYLKARVICGCSLIFESIAC